MSADELRPTIPYVYQADLSDALPGFDYVLCAFKGQYPMTLHTPETRAAARAADPRLNAVPDAELTHYSPAVPIPFDACCRVHIAGVPPGGSTPTYVHLAAVTIPPQVRSESATHEKIDYVSTAKCFLFHHPDLMAVDKNVCSIVMEHMSSESAPEAYDEILKLALSMKRQGPPTETEGKGWAQIVPFEDRGQAVFQQQPSAKTRTDAKPAMARVQITTKNDLRLENKKWTQEQGFSVEDLTLVAFVDAQAADFSFAPDVATQLHGVKTIVGPAKTPGEGIRAHLTIKNYFLRFLGAYIQFLDKDFQVMNTPDWKPDGSSGAPFYVDQLDDLRWLDGLAPVDTILGIPNTALPGLLELDITFPADAVAARLFCLGLGGGDDRYPVPGRYAVIRTVIANLTIPAVLLPFGVAIKAYRPLVELFAEPAVAGGLVALAAAYSAYVGIGSAVNGKVDYVGLSTILQLAGKFLGGKLEVFIETKLVEASIARQIPFAGWILAAIDVGTGLVQLTTTIVEVASSPWVIENRVTTSVESTVRVLPDPVRGSFPSGPANVPRTLNVRIVYEGSQPTISRTIAVGAAPGDELTVTLTNKLGGNVKFQSDFFIGSQLAASASTEWLANVGTKTAEVTLALFQKRIELDEKSVYAHSSLLTFQNGAYEWMPTADAPSSTRTALDSRNRDSTGPINAISELTGLSLSQRHHQLGYAWKAAGLGIVDCVAGTGETQLYGLQSVDIPGLAMKDARFSGCGYSGLSNIAYDPYPPRFKMDSEGHYEIQNGRPVPDPNDRDLGLYYVDPTPAGRSDAEGGGYHLRQIPNDGNAPINRPGAQLSFGRFPLAVDAIVLHPSGRVIAINKQFSALMVTTLGTKGLADNAVTFARLAGGSAISYTPPGGLATLRRRPGLLADPIAVASTYDGTVMVLEDAGEQPAVSRLQAFDANGNPVNTFPDGSNGLGPFLELPTGRHYLDLAVAGNIDLADIYILYYERDGKSPEDYSVAIYQAGVRVRAKKSPLLVTTPRVSAARLAVDLFRTLYTLNWSMTTDGKGNLAGPHNSTTGPAGRTVPSLSEWLPPQGTVERTDK